MTITEFLNARYDEREAAAREAEASTAGGDTPIPSDIVGLEPAYVLADIAAKRAIVAWCSERDKVYIGGNGWDDPTDPKSYIDGDYRRPGDTPILRMLVQPFAEHADFAELDAEEAG